MTEKAAGKKTEKKAENQAARRKIEFSNPYIQRVVLLNTTPAQLVFDTAFNECATSMRNLSAVLPNLIKDQTEMMAVNGAVEHLLNTALAELRNETARIKKIADDNGIEMGKLHYTNAVSVDANLTSPKIGQYLQIVIEMDELICLVHSAWFAGFITDDVKSSMERKWRRKAVGVAAQIKSITNRAFKAYNSKGGEEQEQEDGLAMADSPTTEASATDSEDSASTATKPKRTKKAGADQSTEAEAVVA